ncbi:uncharacterized protein LOC123407133 [Hordeum vulgare subsp. vulgare]|uniref:Uncharacterized protein n=1 Tax=Hordeum vulgare subsp. vulgare TaxID=112509 RepID=A0A8I6X0D1_HORVV|nr:uncharacterized protein LOC123407133 [Hordeum vulgare subsp. vulgare]
MTRAMAATAGNGDVWVEKVDKIRYVYKPVTRPSVSPNPRPATVTKKLAAANVAISRKNSGTTLVRGVASPEDIDDYIARKKREFALGL